MQTLLLLQFFFSKVISEERAREESDFFVVVCFFLRETHQGGQWKAKSENSPGSPNLGCSAESSPACSQWSAARNNLQFSSHLYNYIEIYTENLYKIEILWGGGNPGAKPTTTMTSSQLQPLRWILSLPSPWGSKKREGFGLNQQFGLGSNNKHLKRCSSGSFSVKI